ncbi:MAG: serine hydrolase domain-containing protein, partial [Anaerolineae bacterium]
LNQALELVDQYIEQRMRDGLGPGVALALTDRQGLLAVRTYGLADVTTQKPVTPDTLFQIGSISKPVTAAALLRQREAGRLDLDAPVTEYLDWFEVQSAYDESITVHHLLSHTAGLVNMINTVPTGRYPVWALRHTSTGFAPGEHFSYSNLGYHTLGYVLEEITGQSLAGAIRSGVLGPLGMADSEPIITHDIRQRLALGYSGSHCGDERPVPDDESPFPVPWFEFDGASGSVCCTPADLATFLRMLLNRGQGDEGRFLSEESFELMTRPIVQSDWDGLDHGYGLFVGRREEFDGHWIVQTGGEMIGYEATMMGDMDDGVGVVIFVNSFYVPWAETHFAMRMLQALARGEDLPELPAPDPPKTSVDNAAEYAGVYVASDRSFELVAEQGQLVMLYGDERVVLERRYPDMFYAPHPDFKLSILKFGRVEGAVVEASYRQDWYRGEGYDGPSEFDYPAQWDAYVGHYRTYSPWMSNFRFYVRKGQAYLQWWGLFEQPLTAPDDGSFRVGWAEHSPERLSFDCFVGGQALRADLSGGDYYRVDSP